jgi:murein DD-endopeptidase MepM/ murein hydrolase activator NlpD
MAARRHMVMIRLLPVLILLGGGCIPPPSTAKTRSRPPSESSSKPPSASAGSISTSESDTSISGPMMPDEFRFNPAGILQPGSGDGDTDPTNYAPGIRFPIEMPRAFANSQVWGHGGQQGHGGRECDPANYSYPWSDNFCETRDSSHKALLCPRGYGHQGQDIRPNSCAKDKYLAVAAENGKITHIGLFSVSLRSDSGLTFRYLHLDMSNLKVQTGDRVTRGQPIGYVASDFGAATTTTHLHFEIRQTFTDGTTTVTEFLPPYMSLVVAYQRMLAGEE